MSPHSPQPLIHRNSRHLGLRLAACLLIVLSITRSHAQGIFNPVGAKAWMNGGASVSQEDVWSATNNTGALGFAGHAQLGLYSEQRFSQSELTLANLSGVLPTKYVNVGASITHYGYSAFNQQKLGVSLSRALGRSVALGVQINYVATNIPDYGNAGSIAAEGGILFKPFKGLNAGLTVFNANQARYTSLLTEKVPTFARLGLGYDISDKIRMQLEGDQMLGQKLSIRGGLTYRIHEVLSLAAGAGTNPVYYTFGTSIHLGRFDIDLASSIHQVLGFTPHIGISFPTQPVKK